jgi:hypothetical protein
MKESLRLGLEVVTMQVDELANSDWSPSNSSPFKVPAPIALLQPL